MAVLICFKQNRHNPSNQWLSWNLKRANFCSFLHCLQSWLCDIKKKKDRSVCLSKTCACLVIKQLCRQCKKLQKFALFKFQDNHWLDGLCLFCLLSVSKSLGISVMNKFEQKKYMQNNLQKYGRVYQSYL
jgi:hypothetical protein